VIHTPQSEMTSVAQLTRKPHFFATNICTWLPACCDLIHFGRVYVSHPPSRRSQSSPVSLFPHPIPIPIVSLNQLQLTCSHKPIPCTRHYVRRSHAGTAHALPQSSDLHDNSSPQLCLLPRPPDGHLERHSLADRCHRIHRAGRMFLSSTLSFAPSSPYATDSNRSFPKTRC